MGTLGFERGVLTLGQQMAFSQELDLILEAARRNGKVTEPGCASAWPTPGSASS